MKLRRNIKVFILMLPTTILLNWIFITTFFDGFDTARAENWWLILNYILYDYAQLLVLFKLKGKGEK